MRRALTGILLLAGCVRGGSSSIDQVTGLTVMAIKADPPDQIIVVDGGGIFAICPPSPLCVGPIPAPPVPVTVSALVADPTGNGRSVQVDFATCAQKDEATQQCLPGSPDYQIIGSASYVPDAGPAIVASATFTPSEQLLADGLALDPLHGFGYLPLPVQVTATAGSEQIVAVKTVTFSQPIALPSGDAGAIQGPDQNPTMPPILIGGVPWDAGASPPTIGDDVTLDPAPQSSQPLYFVPELDGGLLAFTDYLGFEFYCSAGRFSSPRSGGGPTPFAFGRDKDAGVQLTNDAGEVVPRTSVQWIADAGVPSQLVYYWIVVLDGRGGVDFTQRTAQYQAP
ncbi:MAG: hypothetical protein ACYDCL_05235 [Myxococcales bacterium]